MHTPFIHKLSNRQSGLSLVELMISLTIGLVLLLGVTSLIVQQSSSRDELEKASRQIENGRYAMQILHDDIEHAGFFGEFTPVSGVVSAVPVDTCSVTSGWITPSSSPVAIYGYAGGATDPTTATTCGGLSQYAPQTPVLVIRRTDTSTTTTAVAGTTYLQVSQCNLSAVPFVIGTTGFNLTQKDCSTLAPLRRYLVNIYYISSCDNCTPSDNIPTLKRIQAGPTTTPSAAVPLVEGIEDLRLEYGIDTDFDGYPDAFSTAPTSAQWPNVVSVRVGLRARNTECTTGYTDTKLYNLGGGAVSAPTAADTTACGNNNGYKRHVFSELVRAVNPSGRRAQQ